MSVYRLTVFSPIHAGPASLLATILRVDVDQPIEWVRKFADEIAAKAVSGPVVALWIEAPQSGDPRMGIARPSPDSETASEGATA